MKCDPLRDLATCANDNKTISNECLLGTNIVNTPTPQTTRVLWFLIVHFHVCALNPIMGGYLLVMLFCAFFFYTFFKVPSTHALRRIKSSYAISIIAKVNASTHLGKGCELCSAKNKTEFFTRFLSLKHNTHTHIQTNKRKKHMLFLAAI